MPLTTVSLRRGKPAAYRKAILESLHKAMHETFSVPADNGFMTITEFDEEDFKYSKSYLGVERSDDLVIMQLTVNNTRTLEQKKALYQKIVECLSVSPGIRSEDVFINLIEVLPENWSLGNGLAQYASKEA
jgi:phenylpyruvate tautomerase PptA (4-oxalocrotonate tautomerase family)